MNKRIVKWLYVVIVVETVLLALSLALQIYSSVPPRIKEHWHYVDDLEHFPYPAEPGYYPEEGFVSSAKSAEAIGSAIIDDITGKSSLIKASVYYDSENKIWIIYKSYFDAPGGVVYIDQQTGEVLKFLFLK